MSSGAQSDGEDATASPDSEEASASRDGGDAGANAADTRGAGGARGAARPQAAERAGARIAVRCAGRTAVGLVRDHNEDNFVVANLSTGQIRPRDTVFEDDVVERGLIFAVCDGMGGAAAGEVASQMAVDILVEAMRRGGAPRNRDALARRLVSAVEEAGRRIFDAAQKERSRRGMGTTATVAVLVDKVLFLAEVGDSRGYLMRRGQLKQLTKDQSLVNQLIEAGHLTEDEAEAFEHSNIILQALGTSETVQVDLTFVELRRGDRLMMCSDGLSGLVHVDALRTALDEIKDPAECCAKLISFAEEAGGHDNITVVIADFDGEGISTAGETDTFGYVQYPLPLSDDDSRAFVDDATTGGGPERRSGGSDEEEAEAEHDDSVFEQDHDESLLPLTSSGGDAAGGALWIVAGLIALVLSGLVYFKLQPAASEQEVVDAHPVAPRAPTAPSANAGDPAGAAAPDALEVEVNIHTDVEQGVLVVNGDRLGEISSEQSRSLKLRPGAYRFEAQSKGNQVAVTVTTVRGDMPMDVFLALPKGASDAPAQAVKAASATPEPEVVKAPEPGVDDGASTPEPTHHSASRAAKRAAAAAAEQPSEAAPSAAPHAAPVEHAASAPQAAPSEPKPEPKPAPRERSPNALPTGAEASAQSKAPAPSPPPSKPRDIPDNPF